MIAGHFEINDGCHINIIFFIHNISYIMVNHIVLPKMLEITTVSIILSLLIDKYF